MYRSSLCDSILSHNPKHWRHSRASSHLPRCSRTRFAVLLPAREEAREEMLSLTPSLPHGQQQPTRPTAEENSSTHASLVHSNERSEGDCGRE